MTLLLPMALLAAALWALWVAPAGTALLGLDHASFARGAVGAAILLWLVLTAARRAGFAGVARTVGGAAIWAMLTLGLTGVYAYRFELSDVADRVMGELLPGEPQVGRGGEVIVKRRMGGNFVIPARVNDVPVPFIFDTGASTVVLRAQDAAKVGIDPADLDFSVSVVTANGSAMAAPARLDRVAVGPIVIRNVRALVARPGALSESLLGMSFLERLDSYSVERGKLVLKAR
jgi:aspartyl protease family protein